jgi:hypothetical protein
MEFINYKNWKLIIKSNKLNLKKETCFSKMRKYLKWKILLDYPNKTKKNLINENLFSKIEKKKKKLKIKNLK